jgi:hypothetical protein
MVLAKCPNCSREVSKPERALKNKFFHVEAFTCDECGTHFKVTS